jgi:hypothetical protein
MATDCCAASSPSSRTHRLDQSFLAEQLKGCAQLSAHRRLLHQLPVRDRPRVAGADPGRAHRLQRGPGAGGPEGGPVARGAHARALERALHRGGIPAQPRPLPAPGCLPGQARSGDSRGAGQRLRLRARQGRRHRARRRAQARLHRLDERDPPRLAASLRDPVAGRLARGRGLDRGRVRVPVERRAPAAGGGLPRGRPPRPARRGATPRPRQRGDADAGRADRIAAVSRGHGPAALAAGLRHRVPAPLQRPRAGAAAAGR